jgi:ribosome-binding ATPase YchF (GTP1/OBG family)
VRALEHQRPRAGEDLEGLGLITAKKVLYVANVDESDPQGKGGPWRACASTRRPRAAAWW